MWSIISGLIRLCRLSLLRDDDRGYEMKGVLTTALFSLIAGIGLIFVFDKPNPTLSSQQPSCDYVRFDLPTSSQEIENNFSSNSVGCINAEVMRHILHRLDK